MPTKIASGDALTNKAWGTDLFGDSIQETYFNRFMGTGPNVMIRKLGELSKGPGDKITVPYVGLFNQVGVTENETLYGNEEVSTYYNDAVSINELWFGTEVKGKGTIDPQRVPFDMRQDGKDRLTILWAERLDSMMFRQLCGYAPATAEVGQVTGFNTPTAPTTNNIVYSSATHTTEATLDNTDLFTFTAIDKALEKAKLNTPRLRPIRVNGKPMWVVFLHPNQVYDLQTATTVGNWFDIQSKALQGGQYGDNPIFTGSLGVYKNVVLHESEYVTNGLDAASAPITTVKRAVFCGANAMAVAFGQDSANGQAMWREELKDYQRVLGIGTGMVLGMKKLVFNSADNAAIVISSYGTNH